MNWTKINQITQTQETTLEYLHEKSLINIDCNPCSQCGSKTNVERGKSRHWANIKRRCCKKSCRKSTSFLKNDFL
jgi:hypothetical protein